MIRLLPDCAPTTIADQVAALDLGPLAREDRPYVITNFAVTLDGHATIAGRSVHRLGDPYRDAGRAAHPRRRRDDRRRDDAGQRHGRVVGDPAKREQRARDGLPHDPLMAIVSGQQDD